MKRLAPISIVALLLAGCSTGTESTTPAERSAGESTIEQTQSSAPTETAVSAETVTEEAPTVMGAGSYTFESSDSGIGTLEVPGTSDPEIEALRTQVEAPPVTYLTGNFDNRAGTESFDVYEINIYDPEGQVYTYTPIDGYISEIRPDDAPAEIYNQYIDAGNARTTVIDALQRADFTMVGPEVPSEIAGVTVSSGFEDFPATPD